MKNENDRIEKDLLGEKHVPADCYWGIHTQRALENFPLDSAQVPFRLIQALALVKKAAAAANDESGYLTAEKAEALKAACDEVASGKYREQFPLVALQGGAGTSTHMNMNEVIANIALEKMGKKKGEYQYLHPLEDVNLHQSTNDVFPTAVKVAVIGLLRELSVRIEELQGAFQSKEKAFRDVIKMSRTEMQTAVPMTLGMEFSAFGEAVARDRWRTFKCEERLRVVNLGGTSVGTGLGAPRSYIFLVTEKLRELTGYGLSRAENGVDQTANSDAFVEVSGILKAHASSLIKIANDLRLLSLTGEIRLPRLQAGSSAMPGKVNPVILECVIQTGLKAVANDQLVLEAASRSSLQINEFLPLLASALIETLELLARADRMFAAYVNGIEADREKCRTLAEQSLTLITAFLPLIGYEKAESWLKEYQAEPEGSFRSFLEKKIGKEKVGQVLSPSNLMSFGYRDDGKNA